MDDEKMTGEELLANEGALLRGLMKAGANITNAADAKVILVSRNGDDLFAFKLRPMTEAEFVECRDKATAPGKIIKGLRVPGKFDRAMFRSLAVHMATLPPTGSKTKIWDHPEAWQQHNVASGVHLIDEVLLAGEKERIYNKLEEISGYVDESEGGTTAALEDTAGE